MLARSPGRGSSGGGALYGAGFKMAAEEIRAPPAPSLYSRPARQSGGLLGGDVALGPARPCRAELGASEGRSGASCRGARGRQWERLREAKVAGAEGNNGGGTWESRGGTSIAALPARREATREGTQAWEKRRIRREKRRGVKSWGQQSRTEPTQGHSPSCLGSLCLWRPVQPTPTKEP